MYSITDLVVGTVSFLLTFMILSYLIGDNPAFRVAVYLFIGVAAGYAASVAWWQVLWPRLMLPLLTGSFFERILAIIPLVLGVLLLMKLSPRTARLGGIPVAFLVGVGAAVAVGGALVLGFASDLLKTKMEQDENIQLIREVIQQIAGVDVAVICTVMGAKATQNPGDAGVDSDGMVGTALSLGGTIVHKE